MTDLCRRHNFVIHVFLGKQGEKKNPKHYGSLENLVNQKYYFYLLTDLCLSDARQVSKYIRGEKKGKKKYQNLRTLEPRI